jgi:hypothetical protein
MQLPLPSFEFEGDKSRFLCVISSKLILFEWNKMVRCRH